MQNKYEMDFFLLNNGTIFSELKNIKVQLMSYMYININELIPLIKIIVKSIS